MGTVFSASLGYTDTTPDYTQPPKHDPLYGFENGRKKRVSKLSQQEMEAMQIQPDQRDYCAHLLADFLSCRREKFPWVLSCKHEKHLWDNCQYDDFVLRMKEFERERRLNEREKRKSAKEAKENIE